MLSGAGTETDPFLPSDYTAMLMHVVRARKGTFRLGSGLDMGVGSGVLLATLGQLGVERLTGVDIDPAAVEASRTLLRSLDLLDRAQVLEGSLWEPLADARFDIVVANLPHFASTQPSDPEHSPYWSMGGSDGRCLLDPFLAGLGAHLSDDGVALITHNSFVGLDRTTAMLAVQRLAVEPVLSTTMALPPAKIALLEPAVRRRYTGSGICQLGPYEFVDVQILEIRRA